MATELDVLQVITTTARRGAERFATALEPELVRRGLRVRTVALVAASGPGPVLDVGVLGDNRLGRATLARLRALARRSAIVVAHGSSTLPASALATAGTGTPFVYRSIGDPQFWNAGLRRRGTTRLLLRRAAAVVALSPSTTEALMQVHGLPGSSIWTIPRGVPAQEFSRRRADEAGAARAELGLGVDGRLAAFVGALSPEKDVLCAIRAVAELPRRWRLVVAGDGPDRTVAEAEAERLAPGRVRFLGAVDRPADVLAACDALVVSSRTEGLPGVVIEAGMVGRPTVSTEVGFVNEIVTDGVTGRLVPPGDATALADALLAIEPRLVEMGEAAHQATITRFSLDVAADRWSELLRTVAGGRIQTPRPSGGVRTW